MGSQSVVAVQDIVWTPQQYYGNFPKWTAGTQEGPNTVDTIQPQACEYAGAECTYSQEKKYSRRYLSALLHVS